MTYTVIIKRTARKQIEKIPTSLLRKLKLQSSILQMIRGRMAASNLPEAKIFTEYGKAFTGSFMK